MSWFILYSYLGQTAALVDACSGYLGNTARNEERIGLVVKCWRSSGVLCVAVRHEHYPPLPRPGGIAIDMLHCKFIFMYFCNEKWPFNR